MWGFGSGPAFWMSGPGSIQIKGPGPQKPEQTEKMYRKSTSKMKGSIIHLSYFYINDGLILTHEIGHALGYEHVNELGHIMNPMRPDADYYFY